MPLPTATDIMIFHDQQKLSEYFWRQDKEMQPEANQLPQSPTNLILL